MTIKIPLAIVVLNRFEAGEFSLQQQLAMAETDLVDGSGPLLFACPGSRSTIDELIRYSIEDSDSTATDMLILLLGKDAFNEQVDSLVGADRFGPMTTILQVRHDVYAKVHASAQQLSNSDILKLFHVGSRHARYATLIRMLGITPDMTAAGSLAEAFDRYCQTGANSGSLLVMGELLDRLVTGELMDSANTARLLRDMGNVTTGDERIKAGLDGMVFAHKTGTQIERACDVGILHPDSPKSAVVVAACAENFGAIRYAERAFENLGRMLRQHTVAP